MFDLTKALTKTNPVVQNKASGISGAALYYQSAECLDLVTEVFRFEGWEKPDCIKLSPKTAHLNEQQSSQIVILELNESIDVVEDAREFASKVPTHKGVVVIGKEDAISTLRSLKEMGFYYVFWPVNKQEFTDFLIHVNKNLQNYSGVSQKRKAKRVAVVGSKGGVGTSFITAELSSYLSLQDTDTILVDHQYGHSNLDVLLSLDEFSPRNIDEFIAPIHEMDEEGALSYLTKVRNNLRLLSINGDMNADKILSYTQNLCELLARNTNFIIEDFSGSVDFRLDPQLLVDNFDVVILVLDPSISAVRSARKFYERITNMQLTLSKKTRLIALSNVHRPANAFAMQKSDLERYLGAKVDLEVGYSKNLSNILLDGKRAHKHDKSISTAIEQLSRLINGYTAEVTKSSKWFRLGAKK